MEVSREQGEVSSNSGEFTLSKVKTALGRVKNIYPITFDNFDVSQIHTSDTVFCKTI